MKRIFNDHNYRLLLKRAWPLRMAVPSFFRGRASMGPDRRLAWASCPCSDVPDLLIPRSDFKAVIEDCHQRCSPSTTKTERRARGGLESGQVRLLLGLCLAMATMDCRLEGQTPVRLSPFSLGWLVG